MKKTVFLLFMVISAYLNAQIYKDGDITQKNYNNKHEYINKSIYGYNARIEVTENGYSISYHSDYGADSFKLILIKNTGSGKKYKDEHKNEYYVEDNMDDNGTFKLINVKLVDNKIVELFFDKLESRPINNFKYKDE